VGLARTERQPGRATIDGPQCPGGQLSDSDAMLTAIPEGPARGHAVL